MSKRSSKTNLYQRLKYKIIQLPLEKQLTDIISNSVKSIEHKSSLSSLKRSRKPTSIFQNKSIKYLTNHFTTINQLHNMEIHQKKVAFKTNLIQILEDQNKHPHYKKESILFNAQNHHLKGSLGSKKTFGVQSNSTSKHLTSMSYIKSPIGTQKAIPTSRSNISMRSFQAELVMQKKQLEDYLLKIQIFKASKFTQKQIIQWLIQYCKKENFILLNFLLKSNFSQKKGKKLQKQWQIETNGDVLASKLEQKHPDRHLCVKRYIKLIEFRALNYFLEVLYADKNRVKMKQFEDQIGQNIRKLCQKIRISQNNQFMVKSKARNIEVVNFIGDMGLFEQQYGSLKHISGINRLRFNMINNTDNFIEQEISDVNDQLKTIIRENKVTVIQ